MPQFIRRKTASGYLARILEMSISPVIGSFAAAVFSMVKFLLE
jgi:hypothetical protein